MHMLTHYAHFFLFYAFTSNLNSPSSWLYFCYKLHPKPYKRSRFCWLVLVTLPTYVETDVKWSTYVIHFHMHSEWLAKDHMAN